MPECFKLSIMGCLPSRRRAAEASSTTEEQSEAKVVGKENSANESTKKTALPPPTIQMVNEDTLQLLRNIGELKVYKTASVNHKKDIKQHHDIMLALENPTKSEAVSNVK